MYWKVICPDHPYNNSSVILARKQGNKKIILICRKRVKRTNIRLKWLTVNRSQENLLYGQLIFDAIKQTYVKNDH